MLCTAFRKITIIAYNYSGDPRKFEYKKLTALQRKDINAVIKKLKRGLKIIIISNAQYCINIVEKEYDTTEHILADELAEEENNGNTLIGRISDYTDRFNGEAEAWIAAGLILGMSANQLRAAFRENADNPFENAIFMSAGESKVQATQDVLNAKYGKGSIKSALGSLRRLGWYFCASAFRDAQRNIPFTSGWLVGRGSSYPCDLCESNVGIHKDSIDLPPYHSRCCCWAAPLNLEELAQLL